MHMVRVTCQRNSKHERRFMQQGQKGKNDISIYLQESKL